jgi:hypothetical protein
MKRLIHAELFKLRTTNMWWIFAGATLISTIVMLVVDIVAAHSLLKPFDQYVALETHGHGGQIPPEFLARMLSEWQLGHDVVTQAATIYTAGQLIGVLLACLLGIVLITSEYYQQTATTTFLLTPHRSRVVAGKLGTAVLMAGLAWLVSTVISVVTGAIFLHGEGYGTQLGHWGVLRAILLNLAAYAIWAVFGVGFGALLRSQLVRLAKLRWRIEHDYREIKTGLGLDHYEGRTWQGWHHHTTLVSAAHAFLTLQRLDPKPVRRNDPLRRTPTPASTARPTHRHLPNLQNPLPATDAQTPPKSMTKHY